jgi:hypothetical protein
MAHLFVPLVAAPASEVGQTQNGIAPAAMGQPAGDFKGLAKAPPPQVAHANHTPKISVQREGDKITKIQITCSCNQVIELDCVY